MAPVRLRHIHLAASPSEGIFPSYKTAAAVQELLRRRLLDFKDAESSSHHSAPPSPTLISFTPPPTYTLGRRQAHNSSLPPSSSASLSPAEISRLKAPFHIRSTRTHTLPSLGVVPSKDQGSGAEHPENENIFHPSVLTSPRGGLATYHGPGQVVLWPVMVIKSPGTLGHKQFTVRCYSRLLENTTVCLLQRLFGIKAFTTEDPGVWVRTPGLGGGGGGEVRKISALGIHLRRHVSSLGAAINLDMPTTSLSTPPNKIGPDHDEEQLNPWARFIACGLTGKGVTCVAEELRAAGGAGIPDLDGEIVARAWAEELAKRMELDPGNVEMVERDEVEELVGLAEREGYLDAVSNDEV